MKLVTSNIVQYAKKYAFTLNAYQATKYGYSHTSFWFDFRSAPEAEKSFDSV